METRCWLKARRPCGYYYTEGCKCQRATSKGLAAYREMEKQLKGGFPRQEEQLPTQPPSQHVSSDCSLANLCLWPTLRHTILQREAHRRHYSQVLVMTFAHCQFEIDNYHMWNKSPLQVTHLVWLK